MTKFQRKKAGSYFEITLDNKLFAYGRILDGVLYAFFDLIIEENQTSIDEIEKHSILFKIWVMDNAIKSGRWKIIGWRPLEEELKVSPKFFKKDPINKKISIYQNGEEKLASKDEVQGLECAAVWSAVHVEVRLKNYKNGIPNQFVESMKLK